MVADEQAQRNVQKMIDEGLYPMAAEQSLAALARLMPHKETQVVVIPANWQQFKQTRSAARKFPLLSELFTEPTPTIATATSPEKPGLYEEWQAASPEEQYELLQTHIRQAVASILKLPLTRVDPHLPLGRMGLDSLMGLELRNRLESLLGLTLSATLVWNYPTVTELTAYLAEKWGQTIKQAAPQTAVSANAPTDTQLDTLITNVTALSDDEALQALLNGN
jgi:myxalamid-type polyketide synthase MxaE and MxaD